MAVLNKIRQRSLFLILVIAMALFSFVLADLFRNMGGFSAASQDVIAKVNGENIKREDFMRRVENMQRQFGNSRTNTQVMNLVWDQELRKTILEAQYDELGIRVERDQMRELLKNALASYPEFKNEAGIFDENKLNEFIANLKDNPTQTTPMGDLLVDFQSWTNIEQNVAAGGREQTYFNLVRAGITGTLAEGELEYKLENDKVDIKYVQIPYTSIQDSTIAVTTADISKYVKENEEEYKVDESRDIFYVEFKEEPSLEDEEELKATLNGLLENRVEFNEVSKLNDTIEGFRTTTDYERFLNENSAIKYFDGFIFKNMLPATYADSIYNLEVGDIYGPYKDAGYYKLSKLVETKQLHDSIKTRHILIPFSGAAAATPDVVRTKDEASKTADSVLKIVRGDKSKFEELVTSMSSDLGSKNNGGLYDWHPNGTMVEPFDDFESNSRIGELGVVETEFGFHVLEVVDRKSKKKAVKVANLALTIEPSERTIDKVFNDTQKFEIAIAGNDFEEVAKEKGYTVKPVSNVKELDESIPGLGSQRPIVRWAFEKTTEVGTFKRFSLPGGGHVVAILTSINEEGLMSTEKASVSAIPKIRKQKKADMIMSRISGVTLEEIAASEGQTVRTAVAINMKNPTLSGAGQEPEVIGTAFGLKEGEVSQYIEGEKGVYIVEVTKVTPATDIENYQANANRVKSTRSTTVNTDIFEALKNSAKIEDYRATFY